MRPPGNNNKRSRGRGNNRRSGGGGGGGGGNGGGGGGIPNRNQTYDSQGPDVRIRGNAAQVYERYLQLARDASMSGDRVTAENYYQHAEHYLRIMNAANEGWAERRQRSGRFDRDGFDTMGSPDDGMGDGPDGNGGNQGFDGNGNGGGNTNGAESPPPVEVQQTGRGRPVSVAPHPDDDQPDV
jgi:hypothetical protein